MKRTHALERLLIAVVTLFGAPGAARAAQAAGEQFEAAITAASAEADALESFIPRARALLAKGSKKAPPALAAAKEELRTMEALRQLAYDKCMSAPPAPEDARLPFPNEHLAWVTCSAIGANDPKLCDRAVSVDGPSSCRTFQAEARLAKAIASRSPEASAACAELVGSRERDRAVVEAFCAKISSARSADAFCSEAVAAVKQRGGKLSQEGCVGQTAIWIGGAACPAEPLEKRKCEELNLFRRAYASKSPAACGRSGICRVLMGESAQAACRLPPDLLEKARAHKCKTDLENRKGKDANRESALRKKLESPSLDDERSTTAATMAPEIKKVLAQAQGRPVSRSESAMVNELYRAVSANGVITDSALASSLFVVRQGNLQHLIEKAQQALDYSEPRSGPAHEARKQRLTELRQRAQELGDQLELPGGAGPKK